MQRSSSNRSGSNRDTQRMKGVLDHCLLALIERQPRYGFEILTSLEQFGLLTVGEGSIYPLLARMADEGLVEVSESRSEETGRLRKYYAITEAGEDKLTELNEGWRDFDRRVNEILQPHTKDES